MSGNPAITICIQNIDVPFKECNKMVIEAMDIICNNMKCSEYEIKYSDEEDMYLYGLLFRWDTKEERDKWTFNDLYDAFEEEMFRIFPEVEFL